MGSIPQSVFYQGCYLGQLEYKSQSNDSAQFVPAEDRYTFVDDLSLLEIINILTVGLSSYNFRNHVAADIGIDDHFLPAENCKSEDFLDRIQNWTNEKNMRLNKNKTKAIIAKLSQAQAPLWKTTTMEDNLNGRRPQWKTNLIRRWPQWKTTSMEDDLNGRQPQLKTTTMEDDLN